MFGRPYVKIVNTPSKTIEGYASPLDYWRRSTGSNRTTCCAINCGNSISDCAIVQLKGDWFGNSWYFVPLCAAHMRCSDTMGIDVRSSLVSVRKDLINRSRGSKVIKPSQIPPQSPTKQKQQDHLFNQVVRYGQYVQQCFQGSTDGSSSSSSTNQNYGAQQQNKTNPNDGVATYICSAVLGIIVIIVLNYVNKLFGDK